jgi:hypothetical protein
MPRAIHFLLAPLVFAFAPLAGLADEPRARDPALQVECFAAAPLGCASG